MDSVMADSIWAAIGELSDNRDVLAISVLCTIPLFMFLYFHTFNSSRHKSKKDTLYDQ